MRATWFEVVREGNAWVVRSQSVEYGRFWTEMEAFHVAVAQARALKSKGRRAQVRVVRDPQQANRVYLDVP
ncbi:MAG TPA: hypothetical protein VNR39_05740 [Pseudolabrys sp.]|nr:hypothetical protein [Pseudolabrys sp.]